MSRYLHKTFGEDNKEKMSMVPGKTSLVQTQYTDGGEASGGSAILIVFQFKPGHVVLENIEI